jgi:glutathione synthase/RimK-type ligase-like ATP-grasp enzyme
VRLERDGRAAVDDDPSFRRSQAVGSSLREVIALVTSRSAAALDADLPLLLGELADAEVAAWDDPVVDWSRYDVVVLRSTWDYHDRLDAFLTWVRNTASVTRMWNPPELVEWNTDKRYLLDLAARGVPIVPTTAVEPGRAAGELPGAVWAGDVVVKPSVGAGSNGVRRFRADAAGAAAYADELTGAGTSALVQPYLGAVDRDGETGLVYVGGEFSHAFVKEAILTAPIDWEGGLYATETIGEHAATPAELDLGDRIVAGLPPTAYARVDLLPGPDGPLLLELELTEPSLFLHCDPGAAKRAAEAFRSLAT